MVNVQTKSDKFDIFFTNIKTVKKSPSQSHLLNENKTCRQSLEIGLCSLRWLS